jgi:hypothetical protein
MNWKEFGRKWPWRDRVTFQVLEGLRKIRTSAIGMACPQPSTVLARYRYARLFGKEGLEITRDDILIILLRS